MSDLMKKKDDGVLDILYGDTSNGLVLPKPFEQEIFLFNTILSGTSYIENIKAIEPKLEIGQKLKFLREPDNVYDPQAIMVQTIDGTKIAYVPRKDNVVFARLMDAGKVLFGKISSKSWCGNWLKINIDIFLLE